MSESSRYMRRAITLAKKGLGQVSPNPIVGCTIVHDNLIIGEGYHHTYGQAHAEVEAIRSVANQDLLKESTLFVTLEPCAHHGKTPPCADLIIQKQFKKVVVGTTDPFPEVNKKGIQKLREAGIEVIEDYLSDECRWVNRRFFTSIEKQRPYIILKWAQTTDGFMARENFDSKWISNQYSRQLVHKWRAEEDGILVGKNTVIHDDPHLTVRDWAGRNPMRIVLDHELKTAKKSYRIYDNQADTLVFNLHEHGDNLIKFDGHIASLTAELNKRNIQSLLVEGGARTLADFILSGLWDEARIFTSQETFNKGIAAPYLKGEKIEEKDILGDKLEIFRNVEKG